LVLDAGAGQDEVAWVMTDFETHPDRYLHWKLSVAGPVARLVMAVNEERGHRPGYRLKLNSYDLGVDIELVDAVQRLRFEHPEVKVVVLSSGLPNIFCAGANIMMLASSTHPFKVNFCKFTNDTRCSIEDASARSGQRWIAALNGTASGGGYELALACDDIVLVDDGNSAVSLPEVPLLGVLPGTGGLTRLVDKRKVRRDLADMFSTIAEGCKAKKALEWKLIDAALSRSKFDQGVSERATRIAAQPSAKDGQRGIALLPIAPEVSGDRVAYRHVSLDLDPAMRLATLTVRGPEAPPPASAAAVHELGSDAWPLRAMRELDDALCRLRFDYEEIGLVLLKTAGDPDRALAWSDFLAAHRGDWLVNEIVLQTARTLRRLDGMAKSLFALVEPGSCFAGELFEIALACDRIYMLNDASRPVTVGIGALSGGALPMPNGLSRLESRFLGEPGRAERLARERGKLDAEAAREAGLVTVAPDEIDWEDDVRLAIEERVSLSPDALTGMEASLRFGGPETLDSKIYGRLSAWQNWIFTRPNATGERGALKLYSQPERPKFDWRRT
jgi:benzoyl-CoA-dihydrodiol lyase